MLKSVSCGALRNRLSRVSAASLRINESLDVDAALRAVMGATQENEEALVLFVSQTEQVTAKARRGRSVGASPDQLLLP